jgi:hypothetical protein
MEITILRMRNPSEEQLFHRNHQLMDKESTGGVANSARNHQLMDEESTGGVAIPPGITSSWTRNPQEEWQFLQELPAHGQGIYRRNDNSARNHQLMDEENPLQEWQFRQETPAQGQGIHCWNGNSTRNHQLMENESTGGMAIPPGFTSSWKRNPQEEW